MSEAAVVSKPKVSDLPSNKLVEVYIQLRDRRAQRKAAFENSDADDKAKQEKIEALLLVKFNEDGVESVRTEAGTAFKSSRVSTSVADRDAYFQWVGEDFEARSMFLEARASKDAVKQYKESTNDLPPGVNWSETITINVRRS